MANRIYATTGIGLIDRYLLRLAAWPMLACLAVTLTALLLERILRLLDLLRQGSVGFGSVVELAANLVPHYLGLALPVAFFVALFVVITRLSDGSEIDALLASGVPLTRLAAPYVCLGAALTMVSLIVFGYLQPYSRYAYRALLHAAQNAGWNGRLQGGAFLMEDRLLMTADSANPEGWRLNHVFIRQLSADGREQIITAETARLQPEPDGKRVTLLLQHGQRLHENSRGEFESLSFDTFSTEMPLAGAQALMRGRGGDERELTLGELAAQATSERPLLPRQALLAELYGRLARAAFLPFLPLLAFPLGLASRRGRREPGIILAGILLLAFQHALQLGEGLAEAGRTSPELAIWGPFAVFTGFCVWMFLGSRKRPGETPISLFLQQVVDACVRLRVRLLPARPS